MNRTATSIAGGLAACLFSAICFAQTPPISLTFDSPNGLGPTGVLYDSGWSLTLRANMPNALFHISRVGLDDSRIFGDKEFFVLTDPDGCLDLRTRTITGASYEPGCGSPGAEPDEEVLDVRVDTHDAANAADSCPDARPELNDPAFQRLYLTRIHPHEPGASSSPAARNDEAPATGTGAAGRSDCYGYGQDDDLPGLVIMADVSASRSYSRTFDLLNSEIRNMAGLLSNVTLEVSGARGASVVATMIVQPRFFNALVMVDAEVTNPAWSGYDFLVRVDGGPVEGRVLPAPRPPAGDITRITNAIANALPIKQVLVRAALVRGRAPSVIQDVNGDLQFTAADLELMGFTLLSNEARIVVRAAPRSRLDVAEDGGCPVPTMLYNDLDGDGASGTGCLTGSSNSKVPVPR